MLPVSLRPATLADAPALLAIYAPYIRDTAITFEYDVPSVAEFAQRISAVEETYPWLVAETTDGEILGYAYLSSFHPRAAFGWCAEISIYLRMDVRRQGIGKLLYETLEQIAQAQGIVNLNASIAVPVVEDEHLTWDSVRFHEKMGYTPVGQFHRCGYKFGTWYGVQWMEKLLPVPENMKAIIPFQNLSRL
jgi:phosphinothricin acetyltransferase